MELLLSGRSTGLHMRSREVSHQGANRSFRKKGEAGCAVWTTQSNSLSIVSVLTAEFSLLYFHNHKPAITLGFVS